MNLGGKNMFNELYVFLNEYGTSLLLHPITHGFGLLFYVFLWQVIGTVVFLLLNDLIEPLRVKFKWDVNYIVLVLACLTGCFASVYFLTALYEETTRGLTFKLIGAFGSAFLFFIPITVILGAGIIIPVFSFTMWIVNGIISILPVLAGLAIIMPMLFFGGILSVVGAVAGRL